MPKEKQQGNTSKAALAQGKGGKWLDEFVHGLEKLRGFSIDTTSVCTNVLTVIDNLRLLKRNAEKWYKSLSSLLAS